MNGTKFGELKASDYQPGDRVERDDRSAGYGTVIEVKGEEVWIKPDGEEQKVYSDASFLRKLPSAAMVTTITTEIILDTGRKK